MDISIRQRRDTYIVIRQEAYGPFILLNIKITFSQVVGSLQTDLRR